MNLSELDISPWILEKEGKTYRLRKYFKEDVNLMNYFSNNNQFMHFIDDFEDCEQGYRVQVALTDYLDVIGKFKNSHSKYPIEKEISDIIKKPNY
tara:strand:+ start:1753 stop:2037 length:285 start_codon:yes stop_codon:yes gene_type:complete